jgi:hypothetical protein
MGLVTHDLTELLSEPKAEPDKSPYQTGIASSKREPLHSGWNHAVCRLRKWLRTTLPPHGGHGGGLTR